MEADAYEEELNRTNTEAERIAKLIEDYQYSTRFSGVEDSVEYATKDHLDHGESSRYSSKYTSGSSAVSSRIKRSNRMKSRRGSVHDIKIV